MFFDLLACSIFVLNCLMIELIDFVFSIIWSADTLNYGISFCCSSIVWVLLFWIIFAFLGFRMFAFLVPKHKGGYICICECSLPTPPSPRSNTDENNKYTRCVTQMLNDSKPRCILNKECFPSMQSPCPFWLVRLLGSYCHLHISKSFLPP